MKRLLLAFTLTWGVHSGLVQAAPPVIVHQLIIVYAPEEDWNAAFITLHESLSPLLKAAKKKRLKVIFYPVTRSSNPQELKANLKRLSESDTSWLIVATHGDAVWASGGQVI